MADQAPSTSDILAAYKQLGTGQDSLESMQDILNRYTLPWLVEVKTPNDYPLPPHRETVASGAAFGKYLKGVHQTPFLYRLNFLKQLSTVAITTQLDATHTRLSHAMGTTKVATRMLDVILVGGLGEQGGFDDLYHDACLFYCFIHDAFHGPMGHSLDLMKDVFGTDLGEKLDDSLLRKSLQKIVEGDADPIARQILAAAERCRPGEAIKLIEAVRLLADPYRLKREAPQLVFLRDIVDSHLDADRLDYLMRDAPVLAGDACVEFPALIESARAVEEADESSGLTLTRLAFAKTQEQAAAKALGLRRRLYTRYYEAPEKLVVDDMVCHALYYILREKGLLNKREEDAEEQQRQKVLNSLLLLTDDDFFAALGELRASAHCYELLIRVRQHNYYVPAYVKGIQLDEVEQTVIRHREWFDKISELVDAWTTERGQDSYRHASQPEDLDALVEASGEFLQDERLRIFAFQEWTKGSFRARREFENRVWARICDADEDEIRRKSFATAEYGTVDLYDAALLDNFPPVHVTTSSFFQVIGKSDIAQHTKEGAPATERRVLFYTENKTGDSVTVERVEVSTEIEEKHQGFPLVMSVPATLMTQEAFDQGFLCEVLQKELESCSWLWGSLKAGLIPRQTEG